MKRLYLALVAEPEWVAAMKRTSDVLGCVLDEAGAVEPELWLEGEERRGGQGQGQGQGLGQGLGQGQGQGQGPGQGLGQGQGGSGRWSGRGVGAVPGVWA